MAEVTCPREFNDYNFSTSRVQKISGLPYAIRSNQEEGLEGDEISLSLLESAFVEVFKRLDIDSEIRKEELTDKTNNLFKKEEYKIELTNQKTLRQLKEKLDRQEAQNLWEGKPEKKSAINRTKNEIMRAREDFERELRKIRSGSQINREFRLFQVYFGEMD